MQLFVNDLTVIDFSYLCAERGVVGESWIVDVILSGDLNDQSMVLDFGIVKKQIKAIIDDAVDHKLLLPMQADEIEVSQAPQSDQLFVDFWRNDNSMHLQSPACAFAQIDCAKITTEQVTRYLTTVIKQQLPENVQNLELVLRPENIDGFYYHYTHGLKKHDGNCQRIAHGHRSKITIYQNDIRNIRLEKEWCERWRDIYIATDEDAVLPQDIELSTKALANLTPDHHFYSYHAPQGRFDIAVTPTNLEVVDCDSTVELLADYIARQLKLQDPESRFKVVAYEGVGKGAIANV